MNRPLAGCLALLLLVAAGGCGTPDDGVDMNADEAETALDEELTALAEATGTGAPADVVGPERQPCLDSLQRETGEVLVTTMWLYGPGAGDEPVAGALRHLESRGFDVEQVSDDEVAATGGGLRFGVRRQDNGVVLSGSTDCVPPA